VTDWILGQEDPAVSAAEDDDPWACALNLACQLAVIRDL